MIGRAVEWACITRLSPRGILLTAVCFGAGTTSDAPRNYQPEGDPVSKMFNAFNGLGIMVGALSSVDPMSHLPWLWQQAIFFWAPIVGGSQCHNIVPCTDALNRILLHAGFCIRNLCAPR